MNAMRRRSESQLGSSSRYAAPFVRGCGEPVPSAFDHEQVAAAVVDDPLPVWGPRRRKPLARVFWSSPAMLNVLMPFHGDVGAVREIAGSVPPNKFGIDARPAPVGLDRLEDAVVLKHDFAVAAWERRRHRAGGERGRGKHGAAARARRPHGCTRGH